MRFRECTAGTIGTQDIVSGRMPTILALALSAQRNRRWRDLQRLGLSDSDAITFAGYFQPSRRIASGISWSVDRMTRSMTARWSVTFAVLHVSCLYWLLHAACMVHGRLSSGIRRSGNVVLQSLSAEPEALLSTIDGCSP
ncbi:unnamed protein product [Cercospora beticola]|nr:unnamed protein product [Cercospora beticola]